MCISILHEPGEDKWGYEKPEERWLPIHTVETIAISVISMLADPNDESPANVDAAVSTGLVYTLVYLMFFLVSLEIRSQDNTCVPLSRITDNQIVKPRFEPPTTHFVHVGVNIILFRSFYAIIGVLPPTKHVVTSDRHCQHSGKGHEITAIVTRCSL